MKRCVKCGIVQPLESFYKAAGMRDGYRGDCKACFKARAKARYPLVREQNIARAQKWREDNLDRFRENQRRMRNTPEGKAKQRADHLKRKYGMTVQEYDTLLSKQGGCCAICGRKPRPDISLHLDHDHRTGRLRGILCFRCNNALGDFDDGVALLQQALGYLLAYQAPDELAAARRRIRDLVPHVA